MKVVLNKYRELARYINKDIKIKKGSTDWCSYPELYQIEIPQAVTEQGEQEFLNSIYKKLPKNQKELINIVPDFMWSFLHEVGHIQYQHTKNNILVGISNWLGNIGFQKLSYFIYFNIKEEKQASQWAVDYAINNYDTITNFTKQLEKTYKRYYKSLNIS